VFEYGEPQEAMTLLGLSALAIVVGLVGRYSRRRRWAARGGMTIGSLAFVGCLTLAAWRAASLPREAWFESAQAAQLHANLNELPAAAVAWSPRVPFTTPVPSVECDCLAAGDKPTGAPPYAEGSSIVFRNGCPGAVTFVVSRTSNAALSRALPWFAAAGREFAVVTLAPRQSVRIDATGTYGGAFAPWLCQREPPRQ
jgi:hypothetical protein